MDINQEGGAEKVHGPAAGRINIFNTDEVYRDWRILTEYLGASGGYCTYKAIVFDETNSELPVRIAHCTKKVNQESDFQKAETIAVGRALGFLGILSENGIATLEEMEGIPTGIQTPEQQNKASLEAILKDGKVA